MCALISGKTAFVDIGI